MLRGRVVVVGVSGGIAAYKACELVRRLRDRGATCIVVMTPAAREFVTPLTFQALSGNPVVSDLWGDQRPQFDLPATHAKRFRGRVEHVDVAEVADCLVIAPATADLMARIVHGQAPDALTSAVLASRAPLVVAPAMDLEMWRSPATQANVSAMRARGAVIVGPDSGPLASGLAGPGRLAEIGAIVEACERAVTHRSSMRGLRVVIGAGRTEEPLDPVRMLTNRSSGRMGFALAEAARDRGANVTVVCGPVSIDPPHGVVLVPVVTALQMQRAMDEAAPRADVVVMAAAVADYRPAKTSRQKIKRKGADETLTLTPNPDILARLGKARPSGQVLVGFALETQDGVAHARAKLKSKRCDLIVLNSPDKALGTETNRVTFVEARSSTELPERSKREVAEAILERVLELRPGGAPRPKGPSPRASVARRAPAKRVSVRKAPVLQAIRGKGRAR